MKSMMFVLLATLVSVSAFAGEKPNCGFADSKEVVYSGETMTITHVRGTEAEKIFTQMTSEEVAPKAGTFPEDYIKNAVVLAKYGTPSASGVFNTCWKIDPPKTLDGKDVGPSGCVYFACNIVTR